MKATKVIGKKLVLYINRGINWRDHRDVILEFWTSGPCRKSGFNPAQFKGVFYASDLQPNELLEYKKWFNEYDFNNQEKDWLDFMDGVLNIFYKTKALGICPDNTWFIDFVDSDVAVVEICKKQKYFGKPNINALWKMGTTELYRSNANIKNGYMFTQRLSDVETRDIIGKKQAIIFQAPKSVMIEYFDGKEKKRKCVNWAGEAINMTRLKIYPDGRVLIVPIQFDGSIVKMSRMVPDGDKVPTIPMSIGSLRAHIKKHEFDMYGRDNQIDEENREARIEVNKRLNAVTTLSDEDIHLDEAPKIDNVKKFIVYGNVSDERREYNRLIRKKRKEINQRVKSETKRRLREMLKNEKKKEKRGPLRLRKLFDK